MLVHDLEQGSEGWHQIRAGIPTASEFSKLVTSKGDQSKSLMVYARTLAGEKYAGKPLDAWEGNKWTERGHEMEVQAISLYEFAYDCKVERIGFVTDDEGTIGCSPDGQCDDLGGVEIKCLKAENHIKAILYYQKHGHCPPDYIQQTQGQIMVCGWAWCDLIFYHPELPLLVIRQFPDEKFQVDLTVALRKVCTERDNIHAALLTQAEPKERVA